MTALLDLNSAINRLALSAEFEKCGCLQLRDVLTDESGKAVRSILTELTPWTLAWQVGGSNAARLIHADELTGMAREDLRAIPARAVAANR